MFSPALAHRQKKLARAAVEAGLDARAGAAPDMPEDGPQSSEYAQLLAQLHADLQTLSGIQSTEAKIDRKRQMIGAYRSWCEGALDLPQGTTAPQDEIVVTMLIWALDVQDWDFALDLGKHVIAHKLRLPERFHRGPAALLVSEIADIAIADPGSVPHAVLERAMPGTGPAYDMRDETRARLHRALGESWKLQAEAFDPAADSAAAGGKPALVQAAIAELKRALELDQNVGVKGVLRDLEREARKLAQEAGAEGN